MEKFVYGVISPPYPSKVKIYYKLIKVKIRNYLYYWSQEKLHREKKAAGCWSKCSSTSNVCRLTAITLSKSAISACAGETTLLPFFFFSYLVKSHLSLFLSFIVSTHKLWTAIVLRPQSTAAPTVHFCDLFSYTDWWLNPEDSIAK